ncbi:macrolide transporter [Pontibacillus halophilus JSM 076056 = DSM 19796]|uniref:Macrolide transporter n=1 Tax=Pontibacillus halophilus JSM 076056 = DSM 19796 TaxID=1385510 RepID=A0A0A5GPF9_9BACI|nr:MFS transporter [Pontibacillus halophilus]KGX93025.1 macrolide transporter [Pontibacillus halophilus JSM 076056 = DSM 19796]
MLRNKNLWVLLIGELVAGLGLWLGIIGNLEFMQERVPSDFMKSLILAAGLLAGVAISPFAGRMVDQHPKKTIMLYSGAVRCLSVLVMLVAIHYNSVWWMIIFLVFVQLSAAFYFPAIQAAIPLVAKEKDLLQINGIFMNVSTISRILGTALAGILLVLISLSLLYTLSLIAYLLLFIMTCFLSIEEPLREKPTHCNPKRDTGFKEVFPLLKTLPIVTMTLILSLIPLFFIGGFNLIVINISEIQDSSAIKGLIYTAEGIAFMVGAFFVKQISRKQSPYTILFAFSTTIGLAQLLLYFAEVPLLSLIAFILFGFSVGCFFPTASTIFQTRVPKDFHGRLFSFRNMMDRLIFQVVLIMTGFLLDTVGLPYMTVIFGALSLTMTGLFYIKFKDIKNADVSTNEDIQTV